ncbi:MAG: hypothetical protein CVV02_17290 [Firmicutes bacterium HGW-Firmicutes-7]|nr:MAG: hypothetical protein CVV02_17290 [Firmicutes bacterium HGW-Firmicutes-7]
MRLINRIKKYITNIRRKELALYISVLVVVLGTIAGTSSAFNYWNTHSNSAKEVWTTNSVRIFINGENLGLVETREQGEVAIKQAIDNLSQELGYNPDVSPDIKYFEEFSATKEYVASEELISDMQVVIKEGIDVIKVKAFAMRIGEDFVLAVENEEAARKVLQNAQDAYVTDHSKFKVMLSVNPYNSMVEIPKIVATQESLNNERSFATAAFSATDAENVTEVKVMDPGNGDPNSGKTIEVEFTEEVVIVETFVDATKILSVDEATKLITKENQEPKKYIVKAGDCPSTIASDNNMSLESLVQMNPSLSGNELINIGDEFIVMVPEPELSITTTEEVVYKAPIERATKYVENANKYVGSNTVINAGADGEKRVTALVKKANGNEINRTIADEAVLKEAKDKVIEKGTKALPSKGATGSYITPLTSYTLSSGYGYRWGGFHYGVDFAAPTGTSIRAADGGVVTFAGWSGGYGNLVILDHGNGETTKYGHCSSITVSKGQQVSQYQEIAKVGSTGQSTGPHVHFEIRFDGTPANPMNYISR